MKRPTSVTVFGILGIVFAILGLLSLVFAVLMMGSAAAMQSPIFQIAKDQPVYGAWLKASLVIGFVSSGVLLACGIGLLNLKPWARTVVIYYTIASLVLAILGGFINYIYLTQPLLEKASRTEGPESFSYIAGAYGNLFGGCFSLGYNIIFLYCMTRPKVVAAFEHPTLDIPPAPPA